MARLERKAAGGIKYDNGVVHFVGAVDLQSVFHRHGIGRILWRLQGRSGTRHHPPAGRFSGILEAVAGGSLAVGDPAAIMGAWNGSCPVASWGLTMADSAAITDLLPPADSLPPGCVLLLTSRDACRPRVQARLNQLERQWELGTCG